MNHFVGEDHRIKPNLCLYCGKLLDAASGINNNDKPDPGDVSLCISCGGVMLFTERRTLRKPTPAEDLELANDRNVQLGRAAIMQLPKKVRNQRKPS